METILVSILLEHGKFIEKIRWKLKERDKGGCGRIKREV